MYRIFKSQIGNIQIEYKIDNSNALMYHIYYEPQYIKNFILTLKNSIDDLKTSGIKKVLQKVSKTDWDQYLKKEEKWSILEYNKDFGLYTIECDIENIFTCIMHGFGIYEDHTDYKTVIE